jgi:uncharacterized protein YbjT (DUF2867 family)
MIKLLAAADHAVVGLIRNPDHPADVRAAGGTTAVFALEQARADQIAAANDGVEAVVFGAGAGHGSAGARKLTTPRDGAIELLEAAKAVASGGT